MTLASDAHAFRTMSDEAYADLQNGRATIEQTMERATWESDMERLRPALEPHVITIDGQTYLNPETCPRDLAELHGDLASIGYANGWL